MTAKLEVANLALDALERRVDVLLLRGNDANARAGGDVDLLIYGGKAIDAALLIAEAALASGWAVVGFRDIGYIAQLCLMRHDPSCGEDSAVKIDLWNGLSWYGLGRDPIGEALFQLPCEGWSEREIAALATFLQKMLYPGYLRDRDRVRISAGISKARIEAFCRRNRLPLSSAEIEVGRLRFFKRWCLRAISAGVKGVGLVLWAPTVVWTALLFRSRFGTGGGQVVGVAGMDGSGKSTLVDRFVRALLTSEFVTPIVVHLLPESIPTPHRLFRRRKTVENYARPYAEPPVKSKLNGMLRLTYYLGAFGAARLWCAVEKARGTVIVFDRSVIDFASDLSRARIPHTRLPRWLILALLPRGTFFYIEASPDVVVARKGELTIGRAYNLASQYDISARILNITRLDGDGEPDCVFDRFLAVLSEQTLQKIRRRVSQ